MNDSVKCSLIHLQTPSVHEKPLAGHWHQIGNSGLRRDGQKQSSDVAKEASAMLRSQYSRLVVPLLMLALSIGAATSALGDSSKTPVAPVNAAEGIGVKGYDPVAYFVNGQPTKGAEQYAFVWKGVTYRFSSADNLNLFKSAPAKYLPQYGGYCAYAMSLNRIADISPSEWAIVDGKLYLNNGVFSQSLWSLNKSGNIASTDGVSGVSLERPEFRIKLTQGPYLSLERRNVLSAPDRYGLREALQAIVETEEISR